VVVSIPIKPGPLARLYSVAFEGNLALVDSELLEAADLDLGAPVSPSELEAARRRLVEIYAEEGYAFARIDLELDFSVDHTRAQARFVISEREQVKVSQILVLGARKTDEDLIRGRISLRIGQPYRRSLVRETEERLATLGVFSTVTVGLQDPAVAARYKAVVVQLVERPSQYVDVRPGFSTGEGFRVTFEYGHRNLAAQAIAFTLRTQLGYLPSTFILEDDVRQKYDSLKFHQRLERRNSARVEFPEIGLGPLFPFSVEGVDVRDNARDYGLTKDAGIVTLTYRPTRRFSTQLAGSLERNDASIFGAEQKGALQEYVRNNAGTANLFRVPEGPTLAVAQRLGFSWDRRDTPLGATRGTLLSASIEHVRAVPLGDSAASTSPEAGEDLFAATVSQFLRFTQRIAGYLRLSEHGSALAASFSWGYNRQLITGSRTYPDRLFFLGGVDSLRGFLQDSLVPEDIAQRLLDPNSGLTLREVVIRGGDVFINPRLELRLPLYKSLQTALFVDSGNLWTDPTRIEPWSLRYATGTGLRLPTPVGPLAFDYGINIDRALDQVFPERERRRRWEDLGAFHFSIGLF
jgi:outer membrane protein assembly factor BamA